MPHNHYDIFSKCLFNKYCNKRKKIATTEKKWNKRIERSSVLADTEIQFQCVIVNNAHAEY